MINFIVDAKLCTKCGLCASDCPSRIIEQIGSALPQISTENESNCIRCQHCLAICPTAAISILGRKPEDSLPVDAAALPGLDRMERLVHSRRSVRQYKDENVAPELIQRLLKTLANVPTGVNRRELSFRVIDDKAVMHSLREKTMTALAEANAAGRIPEHFNYLKDAVPAFRERNIDIIFRGAPHALVVSAPPDAPCPREDVSLALANFDMLAQSAGLGTVWWGMLTLVLLTVPDLKRFLRLPPEHVYYGMLFGVPAIRYSRTVQRDDGARVRRVTG